MRGIMKFIVTGFILFASFSSLAQVDFKFNLETLSDKLDRPWAVSVLPDDSLVVTERDGDIRLFKDSVLSKGISGLPNVYNAGQGGLLDVIKHPRFKQNNWLYFTMSVGSATKNATQLVRAKLVGQTLQNVEIIYRAAPNKKQAYHFAGRMSFMPDGSLVFGVGDGYFYKEEAQSLDNHLGKIIRLKDDGQVPKNNPFVGNKGAKPAIYSYGHRNPQGMFYDQQRKILFSNEHGPKGGDEINIINPGLNYGWPEITYGVDYSGAIISEFTHKPGMEQPLLQWTPSIAPSSMLVYYGNEFPQLNGHILTTTLKYQELRLVELLGVKDSLAVKGQQTFLKDKGERIRDIDVDSQGRIYLVTDNGLLWRLSKT